MGPRDEVHLENIVDFCDDIYAAIDELSIDYDSFQVGVSRKGVLAFFVEQVGENVYQLSDEFKKSHPEIEWHVIEAFRHRIVHGYKTVIGDILWDVVQNDIPELREYCAKVLEGVREKENKADDGCWETMEKGLKMFSQDCFEGGIEDPKL